MHQVTIEEAEAGLSFAVLRPVIRGEEIVITDHDKPVARVSPIPIPAEGRRVFGSAKHLIKYIADDFDETPEGFEEYM